MAIDLDIGFVDGKPTTIHDSGKHHPTVMIDEFDKEYKVKVIQSHGYPLTNEIAFPEKILYDEYTDKAFLVLYREAVTFGYFILREDVSYVYCPEEKLIMFRTKLTKHKNAYVPVMHHGKFINNRLNREVLGQLIGGENNNEN